MEMIELKTAELSGPALDWAVWLADRGKPGEHNPKTGLIWTEFNDHWSPSTDWSQGGPLIEKYLIAFCVEHEDVILAVLCDDYGMYVSGWRQGETHLIAACRAIVAAKLGDIVQIPVELA